MVLSQNCTDVPVISHLGPCQEIQMSLKEMLRVSIDFYSPTHLSVPIDRLQTTLMHGTVRTTVPGETNISTIRPSKTMLQVSAKLFSPRVFYEIHLLQMNCDKRSISGSPHPTRLQITMMPARNDSRQRACGLSTERTSSAGRAT